VAGSCDHDIETSGPMTGGEFFGQLNDYQFLKMNSAPWSELVRLQTSVGK